ncbi:RidA family protein [Rhodococcus sp. WS4]|nr:RidA family protein [Rhodococcus sp. WS4]
MPRTAFSTELAPQPKNPVSQCVRAGTIVAPAGQTGRLLDGTLPPDIDAQTRAAFANLIAVLAAGGASESDVVHVRIYLTDQANIGVVNDAFEATFSQPYPARTAVYVGLRAGVLVEIDALAVVD